MFTTSVLIIGALFSLAGGISYFLDTLKGKAKPNRVTFTLWAVVPFIALAAQLDEGIGLYALLTFMVGFNPLMILIASFIGKQAKWQLTRFDLAAGLPTLIKAYHYPETENYKVFLGGIINAVLTLAVLGQRSVAAAAFAVYILLINVTLVVFITLRPRPSTSVIET